MFNLILSLVGIFAFRYRAAYDCSRQLISARINPSVDPGARMDHAKQFDVIMHTVSDAEGRIFAGH